MGYEMALLGAQLVITLVMVSIIQKIGLHYSFAKWFLCSTGLIRYLYPTDEQLRQLANITKDKSKSKKGNKHTETDRHIDTFYIPRNLDIQLETAKVSRLDIIHLRYYSEYQWLLDFALYSALVYIITEVYHTWFPLKDEINLSMMWCGLVLGFAIKMLISLTVQYFKGEESVGERSTCIVMGFTYLLIAMMILIVDESVLELNLEKAYASFNESASLFLSNQALPSSGPASKLILKLFIALWCGLMGALFTFPGLRVAKMHWDLLKCYSNSKIRQFLLNLSLALPFLLVILWIKPVSRDYLTVRVFSGMAGPLMSSRAFESLRLIMIVVSVLLRLTLMPLYLQAYLDMARFRVEQQKKEAGRITNIDLQKKNNLLIRYVILLALFIFRIFFYDICIYLLLGQVSGIAAVFYYLCVVTLQYIAPLLICLYFTFMYKTLGGYSWSGFSLEHVEEECSASIINDNFNVPAENSGESIKYSAEQFHLALESIKSVFTEDVFRGLLGFATWWICFTWFATTSVGMIYQSYFAHT